MPSSRSPTRASITRSPCARKNTGRSPSGPKLPTKVYGNGGAVGSSGGGGGAGGGAGGSTYQECCAKSAAERVGATTRSDAGRASKACADACPPGTAVAGLGGAPG